MLDLLHLPPGRGEIRIYDRPTTTTGLQWETWQRPRGATWLYILAIGGGAGGGGGFTGIATSARGGGGGGASSGQARLLVPASLIPDTLYVQIGAGGAGVASGGGTAGSGLISYVAIHPGAPSVVVSNTLLYSGAAPVGGGTGTAAAVGAAGTTGAAAVIATCPLAGYGQFLSTIGQAGVAGGAVAGANGTAITIPTIGCLAQAGSGGAGTTSADFAGGACTAVAGSYLSEARSPTPAAGSVNGPQGLQLWKPFFSFGGLGGSSSNAGVGGAGGYGAIGAGGGGGGGGTTGGRGGDGGPGIVIFICW